MENASKALIMAGSILISLLVIGTVTIMYNQLSNIKQTQSDVEKSNKMKDYVKTFEQYNRTIYGSELLSLGNLQADYNFRQADLKGYTPIDITVKINNKIKEGQTTYLSTGIQNIIDIRNALLDLEEDVAYYENDNNGYKNDKERNKRSVKYYAQISNRQIATLFNISYTSDEADYEIGDRLSENSKTKNLMKDIEKYKNLKTNYTAFKNTSFNCTKATYDGIGRISSMHFIEN